MSSDPVLVLLGPTPWEGPLVAGLAHPASRLTIARRCLDTADLLASAASGLGAAAVVGADAPRLDADVVDRVRSCGVTVVGVVSAGDDEAAHRLHRWGVAVVVHVDAADVGGAVREVSRAMEQGAGPAPVAGATAARSGHDVDGGRVVAVWGPPGSPGRTSVAIALADEASRCDVDALLIDADTWAPSINVTLGLVDDGAGLASACRRALGGALDAESLTSLAREVRPGFRVLPGLPRAARWTEVRGSALAEVIGVARGVADLVVIDCAAPLDADEELVFDTEAPRRNAATFTSLECADLVVVVGGCDARGLVRLVTGLSDLSDVLPGAQRRVLVSRVRESAVGRRPEAAISEALHRHAGVEHAWCVPDDPSAFDEALRDGRTLADVARTSRARTALRSVTAEILRDLDVEHRRQAVRLAR